MHKALKRMTSILIVLSLVMAPMSAIATDDYDEMQNVSDAAMAADAVVVRPIGFVSMVAGFGIFIISSPFSGLGGNIGEAWDTLVVTPARFTFVRPLGGF